MTRPLLLQLFACMAALGMACAEAAEDRLALVIGNASYKMAPLANPVNDAKEMAALLRKAGFEVVEGVDTSHEQLTRAIAEFGARIRDPKVKLGLFYFAGHGFQLDWRNYLVPVDAQIRGAQDVPQATVDVSELFRYMNEAKGRSFLIILDACRDDPFAGSWRPPSRGLSQFDAPTGSLLAYATAPGNVALDGDNRNGLYTSHLLTELQVEGAKVEDVFKRVRLNVRLQSRGKQVPWETTSLEEDLYLFPGARRKLTEAEQEAALEQEMASWARVKSGGIEALAGFLRQHPSGYASELAQSRLNRLLASQTAVLARQEEEQRVAREQAERTRREQEALAAQAAREAAVRQAAEHETSAMARARAEQARVAALREAEDKARREAQARIEVRPTPPSPPAEYKVAALQAVAFPPTPFSSGYAEHLRQYRVGDRYSFRVVEKFMGGERPLTLKVTSVDVEGDRVEFNGGEYASDLMGNIVSNLRGTMSTPRQFYPAEIFVGKKWQTMFRQQRPGGVTYTFKYDVKVVGREKVTVPAGTFDAYKIEARGFNMTLGAYIERNIWVVPGIAADIAHETLVRLRNNAIDQFDRQELVAIEAAR